MLRTLPFFVAAATVAVSSACGPNVEQSRTRCSATLTGGLERTFGTCGFDQLYRQNVDTLRLSATYDERIEGGGAPYTTAAHVELQGQPSDGLTAGPIASCDVSVVSNPQVWLAQRPGVLGSCKLSFSEAKGYKQLGNTITYCILRGTLEVKLDADPSTPRPEPVAPIDLRLDFDIAPSTDDPVEQRQICDRQI